MIYILYCETAVKPTWMVRSEGEVRGPMLKDETNEGEHRSAPNIFIAADAEQENTLVPMLIWGLVLILVGAVLVMAFV